MSSLQKYLLAPKVSHYAAGFVDDNFVVVDLRRSRAGFAIASSALTPLPPGLITPHFDALNIQDSKELAALITQTAEAAGLANKKKWSVALPEGAARSIVVILESKPASRKELEEILAWKIERVIATPTSELAISRQKLHQSGGQERYIVTVARHQVLDEYEAALATVGWRVGLLLPRHLGEIQWLILDKSAGDKMLVSGNRTGFTAAVVRNGEPVLVRNYVCDNDAKIDDLHRFALYYRERLAGVSGLVTTPLTSMLVLGDIAAAEAQSAVADALDDKPRLVNSSEFGLALESAPVWFDHLAGAAGLASLAYQ